MERLYNQKVLVVGVDIRRERHTAVGLTPEGRRYGHFDFSNNGEGFRKSLSEVALFNNFGSVLYNFFHFLYQVIGICFGIGGWL